MWKKICGSCVTCPSTREQALCQLSTSSICCTYRHYPALGGFCSTQEIQVAADIYPKVFHWPFWLEECEFEFKQFWQKTALKGDVLQFLEGTDGMV